MQNFLRYCFLVLVVFMVLVGTGRGEVIYNINFSPPSPASLLLNQNLSITFNYTSTQSGGIRIFIRPFTNGSLTPSYAASGSPIYPVGSGTGSGTFQITSGKVVVDHLRFQVFNADQSQILLEFFIPVEYHFSTNSITNIVMTPTTPAPIQLSQNLSLTFIIQQVRLVGLGFLPVHSLVDHLVQDIPHLDLQYIQQAVEVEAELSLFRPAT